MKYRILTVVGVLLFSYAFSSTDELKSVNESEKLIPKAEKITSEKSENAKIEDLYQSFSLNNFSMPNLSVFTNALSGYQKLSDAGKVGKQLLTIVDFDLSSTKKRMWILDMASKEVIFNTYVSHGQKSGGEFATSFSNTENSHQSSLGFYVTGETYYGKNGLSLFIDGMERGFNSNARKRYVVIHGADYAEPSFIKRIGRLGRSYGCPAVPNYLAKDLIHTIKGESVVYIHKNQDDYLKNSAFL